MVQTLEFQAICGYTYCGSYVNAIPVVTRPFSIQMNTTYASSEESGGSYIHARRLHTILMAKSSRYSLVDEKDELRSIGCRSLCIMEDALPLVTAKILLCILLIGVCRSKNFRLEAKNKCTVNMRGT